MLNISKKIEEIVKKKGYDEAQNYLDKQIYNHILTTDKRYDFIYFYEIYFIILNQIIKLYTKKGKIKEKYIKDLDIKTQKLFNIIYFIKNKIVLEGDQKLLFIEMQYKYYLIKNDILFFKKIFFIKNPVKYKKNKNSIKSINDEIKKNNSNIETFLNEINKETNYNIEYLIVEQIEFYNENRLIKKNINFITKVLRLKPKYENNIYILYYFIINLNIGLNISLEKYNILMKYINLFQKKYKDNSFTISPNKIFNIDDIEKLKKVLLDEINEIKKILLDEKNKIK